MTTIDTNNYTDLMAAVNPKTAKKAEAGSVEGETNKFLTLLVTQLRNQDPMNPLDNAQLTSQLAQLSTVTGVNKLNTTLEALKSSYQSSEALQAANLIGHGVLTAGKNITLAKSAAILGVDLATPADSVKVVIRNAAGKEIHAIDLGPQNAGTLPLAWDGKTEELDAAGKPVVVADGQYTFEVVARRGGTELRDAKPLMFGSVVSVSTNAQGVTLNVPAVGSIKLGDVKQIL
ncbi:flagellar hook assembly protein FlgD [Janthinobacterium fluminis]|uniref:Basal-body rod modification protein FlgD n=1 Tax=Janthinobacterium fluminis TaxID=2987524 RepID=A0ABT5K6D7_9BURK|nr:flagellar hook assembly protein FlgD [Janthinobacterium fluminis]MDC8759327.1 flagellar hook assembly protein FlgD [Janthinobacterium fluminis]